MAGTGWREIFRAGDYGDKGVYTTADLDSMVSNFNERDQAPIVVGHPETNSPAWGWVTALRRVGDILQAREGNIHPAFARAREERLFKNRSVRIGRTQNGPKLLHLGYLGAALPEVEGLSGVVFSRDPEATEIDFALLHHSGNQKNAEENMADKEHENSKQNSEQKEQETAKRLVSLEARIKELEEALAAEKTARAEEKKARASEDAARAQAEFAAFVDREMVAKGKLPKGDKEKAVAFLVGLSDRDKADFSQDDSRPNSVQWFMDFVRKQSGSELLRELPAGTDDAAGASPAARSDLSRKI